MTSVMSRDWPTNSLPPVAYDLIMDIGLVIKTIDGQ